MHHDLEHAVATHLWSLSPICVRGTVPISFDAVNHLACMALETLFFFVRKKKLEVRKLFFLVSNLEV
jgi:hypothetical protein